MPFVKDLRVSVILPAAGQGRRMGSGVPKVFLPLAGKPLLVHSVETFARLSYVREIVVVVGWKHIAWMIKRFGSLLLGSKVTKILPGGDRRQDSVLNGLEAIRSDAKVVLVHDAARPLIERSVVTAVAREAYRYGAAVAAVPARDTIKEVFRGRVVRTLDRSRLWQVQTPQGFRPALLRKAYLRAFREHREATDDASLVEAMGVSVRIVPGTDRNLKITTPSDLRMAEVLLAKIR